MKQQQAKAGEIHANFNHAEHSYQHIPKTLSAGECDTLAVEAIASEENQSQNATPISFYDHLVDGGYLCPVPDESHLDNGSDWTNLPSHQHIPKIPSAEECNMVAVETSEENHAQNATPISFYDHLVDGGYLCG